MNAELHLQLGGTLNPRQHIYIRREEDEKFVQLLEQGEYVNVLSSRQMGKSSLMIQAVQRLGQSGIRSVTIDVAAELGTPSDLDSFCLGLLSKIVRVLALPIDLSAWWKERSAETVNQRLLRFFREAVGGTIAAPLVIFLDEIDSTLKLPYTDDLFTAIRGMYNERPMVEAYRRITFCLLGVATPNELIKDRRTTAYNVGTVLALRDFDSKIDDLAGFVRALGPDPELSKVLLDRILHWSGGHPYLTQKLCSDVIEGGITTADAVDALVTQGYENLGQASNDVHFQQILRFMEDRLSDGAATINLYARILNGDVVPDRTTLTTAELKLSGLVKRDGKGNLVVRNPIYRRLFDSVWVQRSRPRSDLRQSRRLAIAASVAFILLLGGGSIYYANVVRPAQTRLQALDRLAALKITITDTSEGVSVQFPEGATPQLIVEAVPLLKKIGQVRAIEPSYKTGFVGEMKDLTPFTEFPRLESLDLMGLKVSDLRVLTKLPLKTLRFGGPSADQHSLIDISPVGEMASLNLLTLRDVEVLDSRPLAKLHELTGFSVLRIKLGNWTPIRQLQRLNYVFAMETDLPDLEELIGTEQIPGNKAIKRLTVRLSRPSDLSPLHFLSKLESLDLSGSPIQDISALRNLVNLRTLGLSGTQVVDASPLGDLSQLVNLSLSYTPLANVAPLASLTNLETLDLTETKASIEEVDKLRRKLPRTKITFTRKPQPTSPSLPQ